MFFLLVEKITHLAESGNKYPLCFSYNVYLLISIKYARKIISGVRYGVCGKYRIYFRVLTKNFMETSNFFRQLIFILKVNANRILKVL